MWALVSPEGRVTDIVRTQFPVHKSYQWLQAPEGLTNGWTYVDGEFIPPKKREPRVDYYTPAVDAVMRKLMNTAPYSELPEVVKFMEHIRP